MSPKTLVTFVGVGVGVGVGVRVTAAVAYNGERLGCLRQTIRPGYLLARNTRRHDCVTDST